MGISKIATWFADYVDYLIFLAWILAFVSLFLTGCATGGSTVNVNYKSNQHSPEAQVNQTTETVVSPPQQ